MGNDKTYRQGIEGAVAQLDGMWHSARAVAAAALVREESRGVHYRTDYPTEVGSWQRNIKVRLIDGKLTAK